MDLKNLTIEKTHQGLKRGEFSVTELTKAYLEVIKEKDKKIKAFLEVDENTALALAKNADQGLKKAKNLNPLFGIPSAVKDNILIEGIKTTAASKILENYIATYDATVIKGLKEAKVVFLGKTNMDEFGMGASCENSAFFPTKNPWDLSRVPGGSSGGSAAAVAASECLYALGSDTGGSVRQPASFCGVVGLKPSYGRVSRYGLISLTSSNDVIGVLAKQVLDAALILENIAGFDPRDSTTLNLPVPKYSEEIKKEIKGLKIGIPKEYFIEGIDPGVEKAVREAIKKIEDLGASLQEISLPHTEYAIACYYIINPSEASSNLARYDGIRYGLSVEAKDLLATYLASRGQGFGPEPKRRVMLGTYALSAGYYDAYYLKAQRARTLIREDFVKAFKEVDLILTPTTPTPAFGLGEKKDPLSMYLSDVYLAAVSLAGLPAISLPCGFVGNLPVGLQIIGNYFEESKIFNLAYYYEQATDWHQRLPPF